MSVVMIDRKSIQVALTPKVKLEFALPRHGMLTVNSLANGPTAVLHALTLGGSYLRAVVTLPREPRVVP